MKGRASRNKGAAAEREFCAVLSEHLGAVVKRKLGQARDSGDDVQVQRFRFEVKRRETLSLPAWCRQVELACKGDPEAIPVVAYRQNGQPWRVVLRLEDFLPLMAGELKSEPSVDTISTASANHTG
jgi:Holliday junction resolvase